MWAPTFLCLAFCALFSIEILAQQPPIPGTMHKRAYLAAGDLNGDGKDDLVAVTSHPDMGANVFNSQIHWYLGNNDTNRHYLDYQGVTGSQQRISSPGRLFTKPVVIENRNGPGMVAVMLENAPVAGTSRAHYQLKTVEVYRCNIGCTQLNLYRSLTLLLASRPINPGPFRILSAHFYNTKKDYDLDGYDDVIFAWSEADPSGQAQLQWQGIPRPGVGLISVAQLQYASLPGPIIASWLTNVAPPSGRPILDEVIGLSETTNVNSQPGEMDLAVGVSTRSVLFGLPGLHLERVSYRRTTGLTHFPNDRLQNLGSFFGMKIGERDARISTDFDEDFNQGFTVGAFIHPAFRSPIGQVASHGGHLAFQLFPIAGGFFPYGPTAGGARLIETGLGERIFTEATADLLGDAADEAVFALTRSPRGGRIHKSSSYWSSTLLVAGLKMGRATPQILETYPEPIVHAVSADFNGDGLADLVASTGRTFHKFGAQRILGRFTFWLGQSDRKVGLVRAY